MRNGSCARRSEGFTLIELLVVISIIALLVSILLPALNEARAIARRTVGIAGMKQIGTAFHSYATDYKGYTPPSALGTGAAVYGQISDGPLSGAEGTPWYSNVVLDVTPNQVWFVKQDMSNAPKWWSVGCLYATGVIDSQKIFYPHGHVTLSNKSFNFLYDIDLYTDPATGKWVWWGYPTKGNATKIHIPFQYFRPSLPFTPMTGSSGTRMPGRTARQIDKISNWPFFFDTIHSWGAIPYKNSNGEPKGLTTLYGDSHVAYRTDQKLFNLDMLMESCGKDPWNRDFSDINEMVGPGNNASDFLKIYLLLADQDPLSVTSSQYYITDDRYAHFWK
jgi:prepilin-type N-terminal cleavage/methylation domain-containing protein